MKSAPLSARLLAALSLACVLTACGGGSGGGGVVGGLPTTPATPTTPTTPTTPQQPDTGTAPVKSCAP
jgi:hypothetical protein